MWRQVFSVYWRLELNAASLSVSSAVCVCVYIYVCCLPSQTGQFRLPPFSTMLTVRGGEQPHSSRALRARGTARLPVVQRAARCVFINPRRSASNDHLCIWWWWWGAFRTFLDDDANLDCRGISSPGGFFCLIVAPCCRGDRSHCWTNLK